MDQCRPHPMDPVPALPNFGVNGYMHPAKFDVVTQSQESGVVAAQLLGLSCIYAYPL